MNECWREECTWTLFYSLSVIAHFQWENHLPSFFTDLHVALSFFLSFWISHSFLVGIRLKVFHRLTWFWGMMIQRKKYFMLFFFHAIFFSIPCMSVRHLKCSMTCFGKLLQSEDSSDQSLMKKRVPSLLSSRVSWSSVFLPFFANFFFFFFFFLLSLLTYSRKVTTIKSKLPTYPCYTLLGIVMMNLPQLSHSSSKKKREGRKRGMRRGWC